ncbi:MAG: acetyl-CoA hydrolase/transferase family protein, partial [Chitinophagales bacterium]
YEMYEAGCLTCRKKEINNGKMVFTLAMGTRRLYDFMHDNPLVLGCPVDYTNDPRVICQNSRVVSVNNFLEVDLTGQVCSESAGPRQITGTGGQLDFVQGAFDSPGGKSFLCMPSTYTTKDGRVVSRIAHQLTPGAIVTVPRPLAHYIVTEFGKTCLKGKSTWERAESLISIAHPGFRDQLIREAETLRIWRPSNKIV